MKYTYVYKTHDGVRHEASMEAKCREDVFAALRTRGIKAIKVVAADGSKANGEVHGVRKRLVVLSGVALVCCAAVAVVIAFRAGEASSDAQDAPDATAPRHQIYGDPAVIDAIDHGKTEAWLPRRGDQLLAWFAQPGKLCCPKDGLGHATRGDATRTPKRPNGAGHPFALNDRDIAALNEISLLGKSEKFSLIIISENDVREVRELKQMVNGLRAEMRAYLANGNGTIRSFWRRLIQRTQQEAQIYERTRLELEHEKNPAVFEQKNQALRNLGLRTIPSPNDAE